MSWQIAAKSADIRKKDEQGLVFINHDGPALLPSHLKQVRSHVMQRHRRQLRKLRDIDMPANVRIQLPPTSDQVLGAGEIDPFRTLPVTISGSNGRQLYYFAQRIAPLHYPSSPGASERNPMSTTWVSKALIDPALLHSTLGSSCGHMLQSAHSLETSSVFLSQFLSHKIKTISIINQRLKDISKAVSDETLGAIALLVTSQTRHGDYAEMNTHMRGLAQLIRMRGGLDTLGMSGLLAGEIMWCDNVTAFISSSKPLLALPESSNSQFSSFEDAELNLLLSRYESREQNTTRWGSTLKQVLPDTLITAFRQLYTMTIFLDTVPFLSVHDMLVYDRKRAIIQHELAAVAVLPSSSYHIVRSCQLAAMIYSIHALWGFRPPMKLYSDLAEKLKATLLSTDDLDDSMWLNILLWTLFVGGYAALGTQERTWFSKMVQKMAPALDLEDWHSVRDILGTMPVCCTLWVPFETLWQESITKRKVVEDTNQAEAVRQKRSLVDHNVD